MERRLSILERSCGVEFLITLGCVSSGQQTGCFLDFDRLHQYLVNEITARD